MTEGIANTISKTHGRCTSEAAYDEPRIIIMHKEGKKAGQVPVTIERVRTFCKSTIDSSNVR